MEINTHVRPDAKLCVCGRSKALPICDSSHEGEGWTCAVDKTWSELGFCTSFRYQNLGLKLASHYKAGLVLPGETSHALETLVTIVDGTDLELPLTIQAQVQARRRVVVSLGTPAALLQPVFPDSYIIDLGQVTIFQAFKRICASIDEGIHEREAGPKQELKSAFISHAVKDEALVTPVVDYLRQYFAADLFVCADSIEPGRNWQHSILSALREKQVFVLLLSQATSASHFCSFEIGVAYALKKPLRFLSLDGAHPPIFVQHIQAENLPRAAIRKPWLSETDLLLDALIQSLAGGCDPK